MEHPKTIGDNTTLASMLAFQAAGFAVSVPFGENSRYDLVLDDGSRLIRVQCKTGRLRQGVIRFKVCSSYAHHPNPKVLQRHYKGEVDAFAVFCPETGGIYLVPIDEVATEYTGTLRVDVPRNNQREGVRFAHQYEVATVSCRRTATTAALAGRAGAGAPCA